MDSNWLKPNVYIVQNGKLVPRPNTPDQKKNYRYIHYDPLNNPSPDDYFRETISRLQKQNSNMKTQLAKILQDAASRPLLSAQGHDLDLVHSLQAQVASLKQEITRKQQEINDKNQQLVQKDKQLLQMSNQNTRLHLRINNVIKQIEALNRVMSKKDEEIMIKKQQIEQYCKTLEKLTLKEKQQEKTMFSQNYLTPKIQQKSEEEEDEFFSVDQTSMYDRTSLDRRYMTPRVHTFRVENNQYLNRTQEQKPFQQSHIRNSPSVSVSMQIDNKSNSGQNIVNNFKNSLWSNQIQKVPSLQTQASSQVSISSQNKR